LKDAQRELFWYRYFGVDKPEVPRSEFCTAFWLHLTIEFRISTPSKNVFCKAIGEVLGIRHGLCEGSNLDHRLWHRS